MTEAKALTTRQLNVNYVLACDDLGELAYIAREGGVLEKAMRESGKFRGTPEYYRKARPIILSEWKAGGYLREAERGYHAGPGRGKKGKKTVHQADKGFLSLIGLYKLDQNTAYRWIHMSHAPVEAVEEYFDACEERGQPFKRSELVKLGKKYRPVEAPLIGDGYKIICDDLAKAKVKRGSVDCIITDPPYPYELIDEYRKLSEFASRVLKPGGSCLAMAGQSYLPEVIANMSEHMTYQWTIAYLTPGGQSVQQWERNVNTFWKPVLWFVNGEFEGEWTGDVVKSDVNDNDKRFHDWGQSESGMARLVERFSRSGQLVCDPFVGGGTTAVASLSRGRRFLGIDQNEQAVEDTLARIAVLSDG